MKRLRFDGYLYSNSVKQTTPWVGTEFDGFVRILRSGETLVFTSTWFSVTGG